MHCIDTRCNTSAARTSCFYTAASEEGTRGISDHRSNTTITISWVSAQHGQRVGQIVSGHEDRGRAISRMETPKRLRQTHPSLGQVAVETERRLLATSNDDQSRCQRNVAVFLA